MPANLFESRRSTAGGIEAWRERIGAVFMRFEMEAPPRQAFPGSVGQRELGPLRLYDFSAPAHRVRHRPDAAPDGEVRRLLAVLQERGHCRFTHRHRALTLAPGDVLLLPSGQPFEMDFLEQMRLRVVSIPLTVLSHSVLAANDLPILFARADTGATAIGRALLNSAYASARRLSGVEQARTARVLTEMLDLIGAAALQAAGAHTLRTLDMQLGRILTYLREHLDDPDLGARTLAQALGVSPRYVRELLHAQGTSFGKLRLEQRLERCRDALLEANRHHQSVSDIAYAWGFNSPAHFSRAFRARYGMPPALFRRRNGVSATAAMSTPSLHGGTPR